MVTYRTRSRFPTESKKSSTVVDRVGGLKQSTTTAISTHREDMVDFVTANWARLRRTGFYPVSPNFEKSAHLRDGVKTVLETEQLKLLRFTPPVNMLSYTSTRSEEPLDSIIFTVDPTKKWLTVTGNVTQMLHSAWGNAFPIPPVPQPTSVAVLTSLAMSDVLTRCADTNYAFGEDMAEVRETLQFIRSPFRSMHRLVSSFSRDVNRRKFSSPKTHAKNVAAAWSEYRFAFSPLVRSVDDALAASADYFHKRAEQRYVTFRKTLKSDARTTAGGPTSKAFPYAGGYSAVSWFLYVQVLRSLKYEVSVGMKVFHGDQNTFSSLIGVRGRDIPLILWETFPLSFMFDRMYDVSSWLKASSNFFSTNVSFAGGWASSRVTDSLTRRYANISYPAFPTFNYVTPSSTKPWTTETFTFNRDSWLPQLSDVRPPAAAGRLVSSLTSTADLAAIVTSRLSRSVRKQ